MFMIISHNMDMILTNKQTVSDALADVDSFFFLHISVNRVEKLNILNCLIYCYLSAHISKNPSHG